MGRPRAWPHADFAVEEAALRKSPLLILYGHVRHTSLSPWRVRKEPYVTRGIRRLLDAVADRARTREPTIDVEVDLLFEEPGAALVARSGHAQLVVVGQSGRGGAALGSVASYVAATRTGRLSCTVRSRGSRPNRLSVP